MSIHIARSIHQQDLVANYSIEALEADPPPDLIGLEGSHVYYFTLGRLHYILKITVLNNGTEIFHLHFQVLRILDWLK
jgi:hypothetical protein